MTTAEILIENDLQELLGGVTPPDLIDRTLARIEVGEDLAPSASERTSAAAPTEGKVIEGRFAFMRRLATAACVLLALGLITWVMWPKPLPETVTSSASANYLVRDDHIQLKSGWLLLTDGAPEVRVDVGRVSNVQGRAVVGAGIPDEAALDSLGQDLHLSATEREMLSLHKRWLTAGGLALCLLTGHAMLNDTLVNADDLPAPKVKDEKVEIPKADDIEGVRKLVRSAVRVEVMVEGRKQILNDLFDVRRITEALTADGFATSDTHLSWDPWDGVTMYLPDGRAITTSGLSWEEDVYDMALPGMKGMQTYVVPAGAHDVLRGYFDLAKQKVEPPRADEFSKIREQLKRATKVDVTDSAKEGTWLRGSSVDGALIAALADELAADDTDTSKSYIFGRTVLTFDFVVSATETISLTVDEEGTMSIRWPGNIEVPTYMLSEARVAKTKELIAPLTTQSSRMHVLRKWTGADSEITERRCEVITDAADWSKLWMDHTINPADDPVNPPKLPDIDFDKEMVVAVFGGSGINSRGYFVEEILEDGYGYVVRVDETSYQTSGGADKVTPYGIFVLPWSELYIKVEENVQSLLNQPPRWENIGGKAGIDGGRLRSAWVPTLSRSHQCSVERDEFRVIRNQDDWDRATLQATWLDELWPSPDFGKQIGFIALGKRLKGMDSGFKLEFHGMNGSKAVLRLSAPIAQSEENPEYENICGVWLFPRNGRDIVIEKPIYNMIGQPPKWQEDRTHKAADQVFGVHDARGRLDGGAKDASFRLAKTAEEFEEYTKDIPNLSNVITEDWVDWKTESVIVAFPGEMRVDGGPTVASDLGYGVNYVTIHLSAPSGVDPGLKRPYVLIKIVNTGLQIELSQSIKSGPAPAETKAVATFQEDK